MVAAGLAPPVPGLLSGIAVGLEGLFSGQAESLAFSAFLIIPGLLGCGVAFGVAHLLARLILRSTIESMVWALAATAFAPIIASLPIYVAGGHNSSHTMNLWSLVGESIGQWPAWAWLYCLALVIVLARIILALKKINFAK